MDKSLRIDLLKSLSSSVMNYAISERCASIKGYLVIIDGIGFLIDGLQHESTRCDDASYITFCVNVAYRFEKLVGFIMKAKTIDDIFSGKTLLMWASNSKYYSLVKTLLKNGVDINKVIQNKSALDYSYNNQDLLTSCLLFVCGCTLSGRSEDTENLIKQIADGNEGPVSQKHWEFLKLFSKVELR